MVFAIPSQERESRIREVLDGFMQTFPVEVTRERFLSQPIDGLDGPTLFEGTCLDPLVGPSDIGYFETWQAGRALRDGDVVGLRWGPGWRELSQAAYGTDLTLKLVKHVDGEPWLVSLEPAVPLAGQGHEILGLLRAIRPKQALAVELLDWMLLQVIENRASRQVAHLGTAIMLAMADMAMSGQLTGGGPADPGERQALQRTGWQPYSVKLGDRYFAFNRMDPLGMTLGLSADMVEVLANGDEWKEGAEADEIAIAAVAAIGNNTMSKTYLSGLSNFFEAMADPKRSSESYAQRLAGSLVQTIASDVAKAQDPYMREVRSWTDAMRARTPGLSDNLPMRRDLWGRPMTYQSGLGAAYDMASPIYSRKENPEPIDTEMLRIEATVSMPRPKASFDGVTVDLTKYPGSYSRYVELAGNALKHPAWNMGAKDYLNAVVTGKHEMSEIYKLRTDGPDGGKDVFIRETIQDYQERARKQLLDEIPELRREVDDRKERQRTLRVGTL
jgi:hypothetical protein